jgi:hypothetical protein
MITFMLFALVAILVCFAVTMAIRHMAIGWGTRGNAPNAPAEVEHPEVLPHTVDAQSSSDMGRTL